MRGLFKEMMARTTEQAEALGQEHARSAVESLLRPAMRRARKKYPRATVRQLDYVAGSAETIILAALANLTPPARVN